MEEEYSPELIRATVSLAAVSQTPTVQQALASLMMSVAIDDKPALDKLIAQERHKFVRHFHSTAFPQNDSFRSIDFFSINHLEHWFLYYVRISWRKGEKEQELIGELKWATNTFLDRVSDLFESLRKEKIPTIFSVEDLSSCYNLVFSPVDRSLSVSRRRSKKILVTFGFTAEDYNQLIEVFHV